MSKEEHSQLELFSAARTPQGQGGGGGGLVNFISTYEKTILLIIGFIVTGVICFCAGVEKGKRTVAHFSPAPLEIAAEIPLQKTLQKTAPSIKSAPLVQTPAPREAQRIIVPQPVKKAQDPGGYAIQVASFQNKSAAQREAEALRKKGLSVIVLQKGTYSVIFVGKFASKDKAASVLTELKKSYRDSYVRRL